MKANLRKIWVVATTEFGSAIRTKSFIIGLLLLPIIMGASILIQVFVAEKPFVGCGGLVVTDEMRVLVAAQAALLQLNRPAGGYPGLRQVLLYPGAFVVDRPQADARGVQCPRPGLEGRSRRVRAAARD